MNRGLCFSTDLLLVQGYMEYIGIPQVSCPQIIYENIQVLRSAGNISIWCDSEDTEIRSGSPVLCKDVQ